MTELLYLINGALVVAFAWLWLRQKRMDGKVTTALERQRAAKRATAEWMKKHESLHNNTARAIAGRFKDVHGRITDEVKKAQSAPTVKEGQ